MQKTTLSLDDTKDIFFDETALVGIATALPGYKLCWHLNRVFDYKFIRNVESDIELPKNGKVYFFPHYIYEDPSRNLLCRLYHLKSGNQRLLPEIKQFDFLWAIQSATCNHDALSITKTLKNTNDITHAHIFALDQIKTWKHLMV